MENIQLQISTQGFNPISDIRFYGYIQLPYPIKDKFRFLFLGIIF